MLTRWPWKLMFFPLVNGIFIEMSGFIKNWDGTCSSNDVRHLLMLRYWSWRRQLGSITTMSKYPEFTSVCFVISLEMKVIVNDTLLVVKNMLTYCRRRRSINRSCVCWTLHDRQLVGAVTPALLATCKLEE